MDRWRALKADPSLIRRQGWSPKAVADWEQLVTLDEEEFYELASQSYNERSRDRPAFRDDERFKNPSQPVVGVTWFEAQAYCRWLNEQWRAAGPECGQPLLEGYRVRLPTEAEWEKAARSPGDRRYPWGKHWDPDRANTFEGHVLRTTPVGVYPAGVSAAGVHDLSGNVWEWTLSLYRDYPYDPGDGRNDPEAGEHRVVRGGSWFDVLRVARQVSSRRPLRRLGVSGGGVPGEF